jgi:hypothetical protein
MKFKFQTMGNFALNKDNVTNQSANSMTVNIKIQRRFTTRPATDTNLSQLIPVHVGTI